MRGAGGSVRLVPGTRLAAIYGADESEEQFNCGFGFNLEYRADFERNGLRFAALGEAGELRGIELDGHPFFFGTLFQPELSALSGRAHPLIRAFVDACRVSGGNRAGTGS